MERGQRLQHMLARTKVVVHRPEVAAHFLFGMTTALVLGRETVPFISQTAFSALMVHIFSMGVRGKLYPWAHGEVEGLHVSCVTSCGGTWVWVVVPVVLCCHIYSLSQILFVCDALRPPGTWNSENHSLLYSHHLSPIPSAEVTRCVCVSFFFSIFSFAFFWHCFCNYLAHCPCILLYCVCAISHYLRIVSY